MSEYINPRYTKEIDHRYTEEIVCPYCGHTHTDSFEAPDNGKMNCHSCKKEFTFSRDIDITYITEKTK